MIKLMGHEGLWYQQQDMWSKYLRRPKDILGEICFAQFAKMYSSYSQRNSSNQDLDEEHEKEVDEEPQDEDEGYNSGSDEKFNYVMTYRNDYKNGKKLPDYIELEDPFPGEPRFMKRRSFPAVLRFNKTNRNNNPHKYMLSEVMLYKPVTEEIDIETVDELYNEVYNEKRKI